LECDLVFVPPEFHLSPEAEKARYEFHSHSLADSGYRDFLNRLFQPLEKVLPPGARGLDFGCGREPTLSVLFEEAGFPCANYDLHYFNDPAVLGKQYDFLTCSETMEHFRNPREEFERFLRLVKPGGMMIVATLNRTLKALALGKVAAEYVLRWVPAGTHDWSQFLKPEEIRRMLSEEPVAVSGPFGLAYDPFADRWSESDDTAINYLMIATRD
jgi:SAM-dependent methyltransferase